MFTKSSKVRQWLQLEYAIFTIVLFCVLYGISQTNLDKLQRVQNVLALRFDHSLI